MDQSRGMDFPCPHADLDLVLRGCLCAQNCTARYGGAVASIQQYVAGTFEMSLINSTLVNNTALAGAGESPTVGI